MKKVKQSMKTISSGIFSTKTTGINWFNSISIERFCEKLIEDAEIDPKYFSQLCYAIRSEINA